jgi:hypothetical protein
MHTEEKLIDRLARLEKQNKDLVQAMRRRDKAALVLVMVAVASCVTIASSPPGGSVITASEIRIHSGGRTRAVIGPTEGTFGLRFYAPDGLTKRMEVGCLGERTVGNAPGMEVFDEDGKPMVQLYAWASNFGPLAQLRFGTREEPCLILQGGKGTRSTLTLLDTRPTAIYGEDAGIKSGRAGVFDFSGHSDCWVDKGSLVEGE